MRSQVNFRWQLFIILWKKIIVIIILHICLVFPMFRHCSKWLIGINSFTPYYSPMWASQVVLVVKNPPANAEDVRDAGSISGSERLPGGGHGNPLQYFCLENPMDRGAWQATVHRISKSQTQLKQHSLLHTHIPVWLVPLSAPSLQMGKPYRGNFKLLTWNCIVNGRCRFQT